MGYDEVMKKNMQGANLEFWFVSIYLYFLIIVRKNI